MSLIRKHVAVLQAWACLALVIVCKFRRFLSDSKLLSVVSLCLMTGAGQATYLTSLRLAVCMSFCVKLISSMDLSYRCGWVIKCASVFVQRKCLQSSQTFLTVPVSL